MSELGSNEKQIVYVYVFAGQRVRIQEDGIYAPSGAHEGGVAVLVLND